MAFWAALGPVFARGQQASDEKLGHKGWFGEQTGGWGQAATYPGQVIGGWTGHKNMTNYEALSAGADPLGLVSGGGLMGGLLPKVFGYDPNKGHGKPHYANAYEQLKAENPALLDQLQKESMGQGGSAAEQLGHEMLDRNQRNMMSAAISQEGLNPASALRVSQNAGAQMGLQGEQQIAAQRADEQARSQQMLMQALAQSASLDQAMAMFNAQMAQHRSDMRNQMLAQGAGAALAAYTSYANQNSGYGADWAAYGNAVYGAQSSGGAGVGDSGTFQGDYSGVPSNYHGPINGGNNPAGTNYNPLF